jgi:uncharacterized protein
MSSEQNTQTVQQLYADFGAGNVPAILARLTDDAVLEHTGQHESLPWTRRYTGAADWGQFFQALAEAFEVEAFSPERFVAQDDTVVALGSLRFKSRATGRTAETLWAMAWRLRDGKAAHCRIYEDMAPFVRAVRQD